MSKVKKDGVITVEEAKGTETEVKVVEGMQFDRGYISPYFMTNGDKMEAVLDTPYILATDKKISTMKDILPILEPIAAKESLFSSLQRTLTVKLLQLSLSTNSAALSRSLP